MGGGTTFPISQMHGKAIPNPTLGRKWFSMELRNNKLKIFFTKQKKFWRKENKVLSKNPCYTKIALRICARLREDLSSLIRKK